MSNGDGTEEERTRKKIVNESTKRKEIQRKE